MLVLRKEEKNDRHRLELDPPFIATKSICAWVSVMSYLKAWQGK